MQVDRAFRPLRFLFLFPCARQMRVQVFFSPFVLTGSLSKFLSSQECTFILLWSLICAPGSFGGHWFQGTPHALSSWALKGIPTFYCSPPDLAPLCGNHAFCSGIFGWSSVWDCPLRSSRTREIVLAMRKERSIPSRYYSAFCKPCVVFYTP